MEKTKTRESARTENSTAMERFNRRLNRKKPGTRRGYIDAFNKFMEWADIDPEKLYSIQYGAELGMMNGNIEPWKVNEASSLVADYMAKMMSEGYSASHAKQAYKAVRLFMRASGLKYFEIDREDKPQGYSAGQASTTTDQILGLLDACHGRFKLRNRALILFLKDSGFRVSDASPRTVEEYLEAKERAPVQGFAVFDPIETEKEGIYAYPHLGPETTEALDLYLAGRSSGPLFLGLLKDGRRGVNVGMGPMGPDAISVQLMRLSVHLPNGGKRISAHSLRKFHRTRLEAAGMPESWVKKLQGKAASVYSRPEETGQLTQDPKDKHGYIDCYDSLRVYEFKDQEVEDLFRRVQELEEEKKAREDETSEKMADQSKRMDNLERMIRELRKELEKT